MTETREIVIRLQLDLRAPAPGPVTVVAVDQPLLFKAADAARILAMSESAVHDLIARDEIESVKIGASRRITRAGIETYVRRLAGEAGDVV